MILCTSLSATFVMHFNGQNKDVYYYLLLLSCSLSVCQWTGKYVVGVSRNLVARLFVKCLPSYGQACW